MQTIYNKRIFLLALAAILSFSLLSPKWLFAPAAWIAPALIIFMMSELKPGKAFLLGFIIMLVSGLISNYKVMPFPGIFLVILTTQISVLAIIPYFLNRILSKRLNGWISTLLFPSLAVAYEYISSFQGGGTWGSIAYTQMNSNALIQLASITGMWGISFMTYWFGSLAVWIYKNRSELMMIKSPVIIYSSLMIAILFFGTMRINPYFNDRLETVRVAGITALNLKPVLTMYKDAFGKSLDVDLESLTQTSPEMLELNRALAAFIENPLDKKFDRTHQDLQDFQDSIFVIASKEAEAGAKIISFSEALMFTVKPIEDKLIAKGKNFAKVHHVYLLLPIGSFIPGKVEFGKKYIENKALMINPDGEIVNTFFKNKPVPIVEGSIPGDGKIPVTETPFGRIATSICYDADFSQLMRQTSEQQTDILILPSGDWKEVSPYHGSMARMRAIENGFSLLRPVSGATSIASDYHGQIIASKNFYEEGDKIVVADIPRHGVDTIYSKLGDCLVYFCFGAVIVFTSIYFMEHLNHKPVNPTN